MDLQIEKFSFGYITVSKLMSFRIEFTQVSIGAFNEILFTRFVITIFDGTPSDITHLIPDNCASTDTIELDSEKEVNKKVSKVL